MLIVKVQQILVKNRHTNKDPKNMTALAASIGLSERQVYRLMEAAKPEDIHRIAMALGVSPFDLN